MDLRSRSHIHQYLPPTALSYSKLPTYVDVYKHYLLLKSYSDAFFNFLQSVILLYKIYI